MSSEERTPASAVVDALTDRITDLEVRIAFQDQTVAALDEVVRQFAVRVEALERDLRRVEAQAATHAAVAGNPATIGG
jgi:uncharacterized coiled-coil protein SlyX